MSKHANLKAGKKIHRRRPKKNSGFERAPKPENVQPLPKRPETKEKS